jgi:carbon-monoxide dehydrogenase small subunit
MNTIAVGIKVNGQTHEAYVEASTTLLQYIREECGLTGTKCGCENGECGACAVLIDGRPVRSCLILAVEVGDAEITTVEGLAQDGRLHPFQQGLVDTGAVQCGFCIPGVAIAGAALLKRHPSPTEGQVIEALGGHLCRCAGYEAMSEAAAVAAKRIRGL